MTQEKMYLEESDEEVRFAEQEPLLRKNVFNVVQHQAKAHVPWKTIMIILLLFSIGVMSISRFFSSFFEDIPTNQDHEHLRTLAITGILCIIPGGYYLIYILLAIFSFQGYFLSDIPEL